MKVKELLKTKGNDVFSVSPEKTMYDALHIMAQKEIGALVVLEGEKLVGIISERDYARKVILKGRNSQDTLVKEIMTTDVKYTEPEQKIEKCLSEMTKNHFRHIPVVENDRVIGVLSIGDIRSKM
jgi:CBS domain-containing protein